MLTSPPFEELNPMKGHNNPPSEIEILKQRLDGYEIDKDLEKLSLKKIPSEITEDKQAGELSDYIAAVKSKIDDVSKAHKKEKQPFWDAGKAADAWKNDFEAKLTTLINKASTPLLTWNKKKREEEEARQRAIAEDARLKAEELARQAEAHAKEGLEDTANDLMNAAIQEEDRATMIQANSNAVEVKSRGSFSSSGIKTQWVGTIESRAALDLEVLRPYFKDEDLLAVINRAVKDGKRDIRGAKIYQDEKLSTRAKR